MTNIQSKKRKRILPKKPTQSIPKRPIWKPGQQYQIDFQSQNPSVLVVSWSLPPLRKDAHKPDRYISHILNKKSNGSLFSLLKDEGLADYLTAMVDKGSICSTSMADIFTIEIGLTTSRTSEINKVIGLIYQYLMLLRDSPPEYIYKEIESIGQLKFDFRVENDQEHYAVALSENLLLYPPEDVICADHFYAKWSEPKIKEVLGHFIPKNMRIDVFSNFPETEESKCLPWYQRQYSVQNIPECSMELWEATQEYHEKLHLPCENDFILHNPSIPIGAFSNMISPKCICDQEWMKLWYKQDCSFKIPYSCVIIRLMYSKGMLDTPKLCVMSELFAELLKDKLEELIHKAEEATCKITLGFVDGMLEVMVFGINELLPSLLFHILLEVISFVPTNVRKYEVIHGLVQRKLEEVSDNKIYETVLCEDSHKPDDKLSHLYDLPLDDVREFIEDIRSQIFIEGLVHGNLSEDDAINISTIFEQIDQIVPEKSSPAPLRPVRSLTFLTPNRNFVVDRWYASNMSSAELYLQIGQNLFNSINLMALLDLFEVIVKKPFYDQLRTKEKLGYVVQSQSSETHNVWGFHFFIESSSHQPSYLQERIEIFLDGLGKTLKKLNDKTFKKYKTSLVDKKLKCCSSLEEESKRVWKEITKYSQQYNIAQKVAAELENITKKDLLKFYRDYFRKTSTNYRQLKINVRSSERPREVGDPDEVKFEGDSDDSDEEFKFGDFDSDEMKFEGDSDDFDEEFLDEMKFEGDSDDFDEEFKSGDFDLDEMKFEGDSDDFDEEG